MKKKIFAVSDIHGNYPALIEALKNAGFDENNDYHLLVVLGDHFGRGEYSLSVYEYLKSLTDKNKAITIMGNHDLMFIDYLEGTVLDPFNYFRNGERETFGDFLHQTDPFESWYMLERNTTEPTYEDFAIWISRVRKEINEEYPELLNWLINQPFYLETKHYIFTHGAIDTKADDWHKPHLYKNGYYDWEVLTWNDGTFFKEPINNTDKTVVIGHFGTNHLRDMYGLKNDNKNDFSILRRDDNRIIAIDATSILSNKVNVLVLEDELLEEGVLNEKSN